MPFTPGKSGNPKGRPPKERALTALLESAGSKTIAFDGKPISGKHLVTRCIWELLTTGATCLPEGDVMTIDTQQWLDLSRWVFAQIDGPPKQHVELNIKQVLEREAERAATERGVPKAEVLAELDVMLSEQPA